MLGAWYYLWIFAILLSFAFCMLLEYLSRANFTSYGERVLRIVIETFSIVFQVDSGDMELRIAGLWK